MSAPLTIVMMGATGAVGSRVVAHLLSRGGIERLTLIGRRPLAIAESAVVRQVAADVYAPDSYRASLEGHRIAICTLGVGQPSKVSRDEFVRLDKTAVLDFARACRAAGVRDFHVLSSVGTNARSSSFYLRTKGELEEALATVGFARLGIFHPSVILTPTNRYDLAQGLLLAVMPWLAPVLVGSWRRYRGIPVDQLAAAIANHAVSVGDGVQHWYWDDMASR